MKFFKPRSPHYQLFWPNSMISKSVRFFANRPYGSGYRRFAKNLIPAQKARIWPNMKLWNGLKLFMLSILFFLSSCKSGHDRRDSRQLNPVHKMQKQFSEKINAETGLALYAYGYNSYLPRDYEKKNGIGNFSVSYWLFKNRNDFFSLEQARNLIVFLGENLLKEIDANDEIRPYLDMYPFSSDLIDVSIHVVDENKIDLGQGVASIRLHRGKVEYKRYEIYKYSNVYSKTDGKHFKIHEESYEDAFAIVKSQGTLKYLPATNEHPK